MLSSHPVLILPRCHTLPPYIKCGGIGRLNDGALRRGERRILHVIILLCLCFEALDKSENVQLNYFSHCRVTHLVDSNIPLTSKQKFRFGLAILSGQARPIRNFCFDVNGRFESMRCVTLYMRLFVICLRIRKFAKGFDVRVDRYHVQWPLSPPSVRHN